MITINTNEIKKFISASKNIKDNRILPIYSYVKLVCSKKNATFYKSNGHSFLIFPIEAVFEKDITVLIEEKTLLGFINATSAKDITIEVKDGKIFISDGLKNVSCQSIPDNYPAIQPLSNEDKKLLDTDVLQSLFLAKSHASIATDKQMRAWTSFVHIQKNKTKYFIAGLNGQTSYIHSYKGDYPELCLDLDVVSIISKFPALHYTSSGNYDCFDSGNLCYGFIKTEAKCPDLSTIVNRFKSDEHFTVNRKRIVDFCEMVIDINDSNIPPEVAISDAGGGAISLKFSSISGNQTAEETIEVENKNFTVNEFVFQPKNMILLLKELDFVKINMAYTSHNFIISSPEEPNYIGSIMELAKL